MGGQEPLGRWRTVRPEMKTARRMFLGLGRSAASGGAYAWLLDYAVHRGELRVAFRSRIRRSRNGALMFRSVGYEMHQEAWFLRILSTSSKRRLRPKLLAQRVAERHDHPLAQHAGVEFVEQSQVGDAALGEEVAHGIDATV